MSEIRSQATPAKDELAGERDALAMWLAGYGIPDAIAEDAATAFLNDYQRKLRTVNSAAELDALKPGTVLRYPDGEIGMIMVTHDKRHVIGYPGILPTAELADASQHCFGDGITVLFTPGDAG